LPPYGYRRATTPAISRLAREGVTFRSAYTPVPLTLPAHSSIFTGQLPFHNGVRDNGGFFLDANTPTLATILKGVGFRTAGFVSAFVLDSRWGIANGFERYYDDFSVSAADLTAMARVQRSGAETWSEARRWLDEHANEKFFAWVHLFEPHSPYTPPEPYRSEYADRPYDGEIAYSDAMVAQMVDYLERIHALEDTLIVLLSDHGEGLGDHGEDEHGLLAYDSTLHVPWIMRLPRQTAAGRIVDKPVSLVDFVPTVLSLLAVPVPIPLLHATSCMPRHTTRACDLAGVSWSRFATIATSSFERRAPSSTTTELTAMNRATLQRRTPCWWRG
jgi:arylsulfatase A-like enzyme